MGTIVQAASSVIRVKQETTWGTQATGNYNVMRVTSADLRPTTETTTSQILSTSREPRDVLRTNAAAEGTIGFEMDLRLGAFGSSAIGPFNLFPSLFGAEWSTDPTVIAALDVTTVVAGDTANILAPSALFTAVEKGDWIKTSSFINAANDGFFYVSGKVSDSEIIIKNPVAVAETTATTAAVNARRIVFGSALTSLSIEQEIGSVEKLYHMYTGMVGRSVNLNIAPGSIINGTFNFLGKSMAQSITSGAGTPIAASTVQILNSIDHVIAIYESRQGGTTAQPVGETWKVANLTLNIENDLGPRPAVGTFGNVSIRLGSAAVTGSMQIYAEHGVSELSGIKAIMDSYLAGTSRSEGAALPGGLGIVLTDAGATPIRAAFELQEMFITSANMGIRGSNEDLFLNLDFAAQVHPSTSNGASDGPTAFNVHTA